MKKYSFGIGALVLAIGMSSYGLRPTTAIWYDFDGGPGDHTDLSFYSVDSDNLSDCPATGSLRCEIQAQPHPTIPNKPDLSVGYLERRKP